MRPVHHPRALLQALRKISEPRGIQSEAAGEVNVSNFLIKCRKTGRGPNTDRRADTGKTLQTCSRAMDQTDTGDLLHVKKTKCAHNRS